MTATERLRELLDERGEFYKTSGNRTWWGRPIGAQTGKPINVFHNQAQPMGEDRLLVELQLATPEQAIAATLGHEQLIDSVWEQWHDGLRHDEIKTIGDAVEQLMYEAIEFGGYMGPNGNTYYGIDEGEVATLGFINDWIAKFEALLGNDGAVWSDDGVAERGTCHDTEDSDKDFCCSVCGARLYVNTGRSYTMIDRDQKLITKRPNYCPNCGRKVVD